ncbi:MAG: hypothetical protein QMD03_01820 [Syntrophales bacterium]|nr:hypothetical protein [Syntrophales bacterium]
MNLANQTSFLPRSIELLAASPPILGEREYLQVNPGGICKLKTTKVFPALEWLAAMCSHIPNRGEQMVRYYGYYSNVSCGKRQKKGHDDTIPCILEPQGNEKAFRKNWARLIQKIYEVDPLVCPKCQGTMRIISFIEDRAVIRAILKHLGLWLVRARPPPQAHAPPLTYLTTADSSHSPAPNESFYADPDYSWDAYIHS